MEDLRSFLKPPPVLFAKLLKYTIYFFTQNTLRAPGWVGTQVNYAKRVIFSLLI